MPKPPKCVSFVYNGKKIVKDPTFQIGSGQTRNISTKILGHILGATSKATTHESGKKLVQEFERKLESQDNSKVRGEYKVWIYNRYLVREFLFFLAVNPVTGSTIKPLQALALRKIQKVAQSPTVFHELGTIPSRCD